ncbi:MAG: winged helix-turn-helix domain-containing protein [Bdellovibrionales bacterium]|nr:winged helix-turn-helix domain-containing protein [Bdellovibrionales bacterium]
MDKVPNKNLGSLMDSPEIAAIETIFKNGDFTLAAEKLNALVSSESSNNAHKLWAYNKLIRIAADQRSFEKVASYIEKIKVIPLVTTADREAFARCLYTTGVAWFFSGKFDEARKNLEQSLALSNEIQSLSLIALNKTLLTEILRSEGKYQEVLDRIEDLTAVAKAANDSPRLGDVYILAGNVQRKLGRYQEALKAFEAAKEVFNENKSGSEYHYILWAMGTCYAALEEKEKAVIYLDLARNNTQGVQFWRIKVLSGLTLAELYTVVGEYANAETVYKKIAEDVGADENSYFGRRLLRGQALLALKKGEFDTANELIDRLVVAAVKDNNQKEIMRLRLLKAEVLLRTGDAVQQDEARDMLQEALAFFRERDIRRHQAVGLELLARLDSRSGYPADALKKVEETLVIARDTSFDRLTLRAQLAQLVLRRKLGESITAEQIANAETLINKLNAGSERMILNRFRVENYEAWSQELRRQEPNARRYVNEFFEDFHFVPKQSTDIEIDRNSHYIREKHLGEIPFHNKFTLMRILCLLAETPGNEYSKEQLAKEIWGQEYNPLRHDNNIYININRLRKLIEPNPRESRYIMNGPRGYYFNPEMKVNISSKISDVAPRAISPSL